MKVHWLFSLLWYALNHSTGPRLCQAGDLHGEATASGGQIADDIESELYQSMTREIESTAIGEKVMEKLKKLDEVAYVRFASVYREFKDVSTFMDELKKFMN